MTLPSQRWLVGKPSLVRQWGLFFVSRGILRARVVLDAARCRSLGDARKGRPRGGNLHGNLSSRRSSEVDRRYQGDGVTLSTRTVAGSSPAAKRKPPLVSRLAGAFLRSSVASRIACSARHAGRLAPRRRARQVRPVAPKGTPLPCGRGQQQGGSPRETRSPRAPREGCES